MVRFIIHGISEGRVCGDPGVNVLETTRIQTDLVEEIADSRAFIAGDVTSVTNSGFVGSRMSNSREKGL